jgi:putative transposase
VQPVLLQPHLLRRLPPSCPALGRRLFVSGRTQNTQGLQLLTHLAACLVAALLRTVFAQDSRTECHQQWRLVADQLREKYPKIATLMDGCEDEVLAHMALPKAHRQQLHSTNPLERLNAEIKRCTDAVGIFPNDPAITRLVGAMLLEQNDEWCLQRRYMQLEAFEAVSDNPQAKLSAVIN